MMQIMELAWPMIGAAIAGGMIGAEREFRSSPAGFRTHILVALSSALLMLGAVHQIHWLTDASEDIIRIDPVRMAHGVLTGIGFLCGGVIFREGVTVRGLTTAASLWTTSALGVLFGVGFYSLAIGGTVATILVLAASDLTERFLPHRQTAELTVVYDVSEGKSWSDLSALLAEHRIEAMDVSESVDAKKHELTTIIFWRNGDSDRALVDALRADPTVSGFNLVRH